MTVVVCEFIYVVCYIAHMRNCESNQINQRQKKLWAMGRRIARSRWLVAHPTAIAPESIDGSSRAAASSTGSRSKRRTAWGWNIGAASVLNTSSLVGYV